MGGLLKTPKSLSNEDFLNDMTHLPYPADMDLYTTPPLSLKWDKTDGQEFQLTVNAEDTQIAAAFGVDIGVPLDLALKKKNFFINPLSLDELEIMVTQPTKQYVEDCTNAVKMPKTITGRQAYMITGLIIAGNKSTGEKFVWAVRMTKLSKAWFHKDWVQTPATRNQGGKSVGEILQEEAFSQEQIENGASSPFILLG